MDLNDLNIMVSVETLLNYPALKVPFTLDTGTYYRQLSTFISQSNKSIYYYLKY